MHALHVPSDLYSAIHLTAALRDTGLYSCFTNEEIEVTELVQGQITGQWLSGGLNSRVCDFKTQGISPVPFCHPLKNNTNQLCTGFATTAPS